MIKQYHKRSELVFHTLQEGEKEKKETVWKTINFVNEKKH